MKPNTNNFKFKLIDDEGVKQLIKQAKATNSVGNDIISMKTVKKLAPLINPHIKILIIPLLTLRPIH